MCAALPSLKPNANQQARQSQKGLMVDMDKYRAEPQGRTGDQPNSMDQARVANPAGRLTAEQQRRMARKIWSRFSVHVFLVACLLMLGGVLLFFGLFMPGMQPNLSLYLLFGGYTGLLLLILGAVLLRGAILLLEVRTGQLAHATGQITLSGGAYHAQVPGRRLDLTGLYYLPGDYVFYFLPRSGQVASAELAPSDRSYSAEPAPTGLAKTMARPQQPALTDDQLLHALAKTNHFSLGDLAAYREGKLGWSGLREMLKTTSSVVLMLICGLVAVATWLYVIVPILISIPRHPLMTTLLELAITAPLAIPSLYVALTMVVGAWTKGP